MIRFSTVSLVILCGNGTPAEVTAHLGVRSSGLRGDANGSRRVPGPFGDRANTWVLDSPRGAESDATERLAALADVIEPFGDKLLTLDGSFKRRIDIVYHLTPRQPHGIAGEFDWLTVPAAVMKRLASWNLDLCYECQWFDHPEWVRPRNRGFFSRMFGGSRKR